MDDVLRLFIRILCIIVVVQFTKKMKPGRNIPSRRCRGRCLTLYILFFSLLFRVGNSLEFARQSSLHEGDVRIIEPLLDDKAPIAGSQRPASRVVSDFIAWIMGWWGSCFWRPALERIEVIPLYPDGSRASTAELWLPKKQMAKEYLQREQVDMIGLGWPHRKRQIPWYTYNSSDAAHLVPGSLSWMLDAQEMKVRAEGGMLDIDVARSVSKLVAATYCNAETLQNWNCTRCKNDFQLEKAIFDPLWDLQGFVGWSDTLNGIVIAFRGTDSHSYYNWVENMRTWRTDLSLAYEGMPKHALVHGGFFYSYNNSFLAGNVSKAVSSIVRRQELHPRGRGGGSGGGWDAMRKGLGGADIGPAPTIFVSGHSLGGALATVCAMELKMTLKLPDVRLITFGSPRVGNQVFATWYGEYIAPHWRFTHNRDMVPSVPPGYMGFSHIAQEIWVVDIVPGKTLVGICDGSGEDPKCHNSVCHLGLCSSLADHLLYLSEMYTPRPNGC